MEEDEIGGLWDSFITRSFDSRKEKYTPIEAAKALGIYTKKRDEPTALKRFLFWFYVKGLNPKISYKEIGVFTSGHDHSAVLHGVRYASDPQNRKAYLEKFSEEIYSIIIKTDFTNDKKKGEGVERYKTRKAADKEKSI
jgi:hypothetical protein